MIEQTDFKFPYDPDEELRNLLGQEYDDRFADPRSEHRIWTDVYRDVSTHGIDYPDFIGEIRRLMDEIREEYPYMNLKDEDFTLSTDVGWCYEDSYGKISIHAEVVEREDQWKGRLYDLRASKEREIEQLKIMSEKLGYKIEKI